MLALRKLAALGVVALAADWECWNIPHGVVARLESGLRVAVATFPVPFAGSPTYWRAVVGQGQGCWLVESHYLPLGALPVRLQLPQTPVLATSDCRCLIGSAIPPLRGDPDGVNSPEIRVALLPGRFGRGGRQ